jgi:hypothetical protein
VTKRMIQLTLAIGTGIIALLAMVTLLVGPVRPALAAGPDCTVDPGGGGDYTTIQGAVDDPGCTTINVGAGTYNENVAIARSLTLQGAGATSTIIDGGRAGVVISITNSADVTLDGFTITGGDGSTNNGGGGIFIREATAIIRDNAISDNVGSQDATTGGLGGGILVISSTNPVQIYDNTIQANVAHSVTLAAPMPIPVSVGGGIVIGDASSAIITGNQVLSNVALRSNIPPQDTWGGGGGIAWWGEQITIDDNTIQGNLGNEAGGDGDGGGIFLWEGTLGKVATVTNNSIAQNTAAVSGTYASGGGIYARNVQMLTLTDNRVMQNTALVSGSDGQGGGVYLFVSSGSGPRLTLTGNWVMSNTAGVTVTSSSALSEPFAGGGGIRIWGGDADNDTLVMQDNHLIGNVAAQIMTTAPGDGWGHAEGGGLAASRISTTLISNNEVRENAAVENLSLSGSPPGDDWGGRPAGGGMYLSENDTVTLSNNEVRDNIAAGQQVVNDVNSTSEGGGIALINVTNATVNDNTISGNAAVVTGSITSNTGKDYSPNGGGVRAGCWDKPACNLSLVGNDILNNVAARSVTVSGTNANGGGGGGGFSLDQSTALLQSNVISGNTGNLTGDGWGGGINANESTVAMERNLILGNRMNPTYNGGSGGVWVWQSTLTSTNDIFARNYDGIGGGDGGGTVSSLTLVNDTFYNNGHVGVSVHNSSTAYVTNTIVYSHETGLEGYDSATVTGDYNLVSNTNNYAGGATGGTHDIIGQDPLFKNAAADDLRLTSGSPAIDKGNDAVAPAVDFDRDSRPFGDHVDIGADEFGKVVHLSIILKNASP